MELEKKGACSIILGCNSTVNHYAETILHKGIIMSSCSAVDLYFFFLPHYTLTRGEIFRFKSVWTSQSSEIEQQLVQRIQSLSTIEFSYHNLIT